MSTQRLLGLLLLGGLLWWVLSQPPEEPPKPAPPPAPEPCPVPDDPKPRPRPKPRPWGKDAPGPVGPVEAGVGGSRAPDGTEVQCDLPPAQHLKNVGGSDGSGLCVFTSLAHSARWQNVRVLEDFRDWMRRRPGGGWPDKVDRMIAQVCQERGVAKPPYVQVEGNDLEILKLACRTGRLPAVTYSFSPSGRYGGRRIAHMVSLLHADERWFCVLDNNFPQTYEWMSPDEFRRSYTGGRSGWAVILLSPGPPPVPKN